MFSLERVEGRRKRGAGMKFDRWRKQLEREESDDWPEGVTMKPPVRRLPPFHPTAHLTNHIVEISLGLAPVTD